MSWQDSPKTEIPEKLSVTASELPTHAHGASTSWSVTLPSKVIGMHLEQLPPLSSTTIHKHDEAMIYILSGQGHSEIQGRRVELKEGTFLLIPAGAWHRHWNDDTAKPLRYVASYATPLMRYVNMHQIIDKGFKTFADLEKEGSV